MQDNKTTQPESRSILNLSIVEHRDRLAAAKPMLNAADVPFF